MFSALWWTRQGLSCSCRPTEWSRSNGVVVIAMGRKTRPLVNKIPWTFSLTAGRLVVFPSYTRCTYFLPSRCTGFCYSWRSDGCGWSNSRHGVYDSLLIQLWMGLLLLWLLDTAQHSPGSQGPTDQQARKPFILGRLNAQIVFNSVLLGNGMWRVWLSDCHRTRNGPTTYMKTDTTCLELSFSDFYYYCSRWLRSVNFKTFMPWYHILWPGAAQTKLKKVRIVHFLTLLFSLKLINRISLVYPL